MPHAIMMLLCFVLIPPTLTHATQIDAVDLSFELQRIAQELPALDPSEVPTLRDDLDYLLELEWINFSRPQLDHALIKIAQIKTYLESADEGNSDDKSAPSANGRVVKCIDKAFRIPKSTIKDFDFCKGIKSVIQIEKRAKSDGIVRRGLKIMYGDNFFDLTTPEKILVIVNKHQQIDKFNQDPLAFLNIAKDAALKQIEKEAEARKRERERRERVEELLRIDRAGMARERWDARRADRESYRLRTREDFAHTA